MSVPLPPRWVRRVVIDPLWLPLALVLEAVFAVAMLCSALVYPVSSRHRVLRLGAFAATYIALDVWMMLAAFGLWLTRPLRRLGPEEWVAAHSRLLRGALDRLQRVAHRSFGFTVHIDAAAAVPPPGRPVIALARHAGPGDSFTLVQLLISSWQRNPRVVMKSALRWDPGLDVLLTRLAGCFIPSHSGAADDRVALVAAHARSLGPDDALLLFPEGGNWTPRRHRRAVMRLLRSGRVAAARRARRQAHVLPPRPGGTAACLTARPDADVLLVAHTGLDALTSPALVWKAVPVGDRPMVICSWLYPAESVPRTEEAAAAWLEERWTEVSGWVDAHAAAPLAGDQLPG